jgi:hypothetical protein
MKRHVNMLLVLTGTALLFGCQDSGTARGDLEPTVSSQPAEELGDTSPSGGPSGVTGPGGEAMGETDAGGKDDVGVGTSGGATGTTSGGTTGGGTSGGGTSGGGSGGAS